MRQTYVLDVRKALHAYAKAMKPIWNRVSASDIRAVYGRHHAPLLAASRAWLRELRRMIRVDPSLFAHLGPGKPKAGEIISRLADWDAVKEAGLQLFGKPFLDTVQDGVLSIRHVHLMKVRIDPIGEKAVAWARKGTAELVTEITEETRQSIQEGIAQAIDSGRPLDAYARELRTEIGLTSDQRDAVDALIRKDLEDGMSLDDALAAGDAYSADLLDYRAEMIARTESARATTAGLLGAYAENGIRSVDWICDPDACDDCQAMAEGGPYDIDDIEGELPLHPNCACCLVANLEEGPGETPEGEGE